jgi:hypothetical protein
MLYPVIISGSKTLTNSLQAINKSDSSLKEKTFVPTIGAQFLRVNTFLMKGSLSPLI